MTANFIFLQIIREKFFGCNDFCGNENCREKNIYNPAQFVQNKENIFYNRSIFREGDFLKSLGEKIWQPFFIEDIFEISSGKRLTKNEMIAGNIPFVGATDSNNGVTAFVGNENSSLDKNVLGVNYNGSIVENFYHPYTAIFSDDVKRFKLENFSGNEFVYLSLKTVILRQKNKYAYGYKFNETRMKRQKIMLPVNEKGEPDFEYMENYMREVEERLLQNYLSRFEIPDAENVLPLNEKTWRPFKLANYFDFIKGDQNHMSELLEGDIPLVSAKNTNNGYKNFVGANNKKIFCGHCLTINNDGDGGAGISYYQPTKMLLDTHVTALIPKINLSKESLLFVSRCITIQREKFGYGYSLNDRRLRVFEIMLPVNEKGEPDFEYMEKYMRAQEAKILREYAKKMLEGGKCADD